MAAPEGKPSDATPDEPGASSGNGASDAVADSSVKESGNGTGASDKVAETTAASASNGASDKKLEQHHVSKILDEVLEESKQAGEMSFKHPMLLDLALAIGLLLAVAGFMIGIMNMWIAHQAKESIMHKNYRAAISMLKSVPFSELNLFMVPGADSPNELMAQALYQEAMEKLDANPDDQSAIEELSKIQAGSAFFDNAQEIVKEHTVPSETQLKGSAEHQATPEEVVAPPKPLLPPPENEDGSK